MAELVVPFGALSQGDQLRLIIDPGIPGLTDWSNTNFIRYGNKAVRRDGIEFVAEVPANTGVLKVEYVGDYEHLTPIEGVHAEADRDVRRAAEWNIIKALAEVHPRPLTVAQMWEAIGWRRHLMTRVSHQDAVQRLEHPDRRFIVPVAPQGTYLPTGDALRYYELNRTKKR